MLNNGETTWSAAKAYSLGSQNPQDNSVWGGGRVGLPADIAPGQTAVFNFQVRAPQATGPANFQWRMVRDGYEWFGGYSSNVVVNVTPTPRNDAALMGQTVPAQMYASQSYPVTAVMRNTGTTTWTQAGAYSLAIFQSSAGHSWVNVGRAALPHSVAPGQDVTFSFNAAAPSALGNYPLAFQMVQDGVELFGAVSNSASVNVVAVPSRNDAAVAAVTVPPRMTTGQMYPVTIVMQNTGNTTWSAGTMHRLGEAGGHGAMWGIERVALATAVAPGQQYTFTFQVTAPAAGLYDMQWRMVQDGLEFFGAPAGNQVTVTEDLSRVTFIHTDGLGSPVARTDGAGTVLSRTRYEPYGYVAAGATPTIGFTGHVNDADTGLTYMQQRYYDPVAGRFLSVDPVLTDANTGGSFNRYSYAANNPLEYVDPDGRAIETALDVASLALSVSIYKNEPTVLNGIAVGIDGLAAAVPFVPGGLGTIRTVLGKVGAAAADANQGGKVGGRNANKVGPVGKAEGPHSVVKRDADGNVMNTATYRPNSQNPTGFDEVKRVDVTGKAHTNPDGTNVPTPHVHEADAKGVRPATPEDFPRK